VWVLADQVEGERRVGRVAQRVEDRRHLVGDVVGQVVGVHGRDREILGESARPVDPDAQGVGAEVAPPGAAVAALAAGDVALARDPVARLEAGDFAADLGDHAAELVAHGHGHGDGLARPFVPVVDMHVGAADRGLADLDQEIVGPDPRLRHAPARPSP
jgi:hypothetical protein